MNHTTMSLCLDIELALKVDKQQHRLRPVTCLGNNSRSCACKHEIATVTPHWWRPALRGLPKKESTFVSRKGIVGEHVPARLVCRIASLPRFPDEMPAREREGRERPAATLEGLPTVHQ